MGDVNSFDSLSNEKTNYIKKNIKDNFILLFILVSTFFVGSNLYFDKKSEESNHIVKMEIDKLQDLKIANQRTIDDKQKVSDLKHDGIYDTIEKTPSLNQSLDNLNQYSNKDPLAVDYEVYGGFYEELNAIVKISQDVNLKADLRVALEDGILTFDEYKHLKEKYNFDNIKDNYEAENLRRIIENGGEKK